jgi:uncharacterized membrane protein HdeD (DUF308 family)
MSNTSFLLIRGILGVITGLLALALPGVTIAVLVILFGIYAFPLAWISGRICWRAASC